MAARLTYVSSEELAVSEDLEEVGDEEGARGEDEGEEGGVGLRLQGREGLDLDARGSRPVPEPGHVQPRYIQPGGGQRRHVQHGHVAHGHGRRTRYHSVLRQQRMLLKNLKYKMPTRTEKLSKINETKLMKHGHGRSARCNSILRQQRMLLKNLKYKISTRSEKLSNNNEEAR